MEWCSALVATVRVAFPSCIAAFITSLITSANIIWKHGLNALPEDQQKSSKGRVSIILWGQVSDVIEEAGAPPMVPAHSHGGYKWDCQMALMRALLIYCGSYYLINFEKYNARECCVNLRYRKDSDSNHKSAEAAAAAVGRTAMCQHKASWPHVGTTGEEGNPQISTEVNCNQNGGVWQKMAIYDSYFRQQIDRADNGTWKIYDGTGVKKCDSQEKEQTTKIIEILSTLLTTNLLTFKASPKFLFVIHDHARCHCSV
jgi:hypothetical protein